MDINFTKREDNLAFATLKKRDIFYCCDDEDENPALYMVTDNIYYNDYFGTSCYNCICLNTGSFGRMESDAAVRLCKATINVEG